MLIKNNLQLFFDESHWTTTTASVLELRQYDSADLSKFGHVGLSEIVTLCKP